MKIAVMGSGAVGCYYGGMLARAGHEVTLIGRAQHVDAIRAGGLLLDTQTFRETVALSASVDPAAAAGAELLLFCVKSTDTANAADELAPHLAAEAFVLSLQNGVDNAVRLRERLSHEVAPAIVYVATEMAAPGHVRHHGRGELVLGSSPRSEATAALLTAAGIPTQVSDNVAGTLWAKLIVNCAYNALSAVAQQPYGKLVQAEGVTAVISDVVHECLAVARADGVSGIGDADEAVLQIPQTMATQYSSTAQDLARGKPSEIEHLNGYVVRRGEALGVPTPANRVLVTVVKLLEKR